VGPNRRGVEQKRRTGQNLQAKRKKKSGEVPNGHFGTEEGKATQKFRIFTERTENRGGLSILRGTNRKKKRKTPRHRQVKTGTSMVFPHLSKMTLGVQIKGSGRASKKCHSRDRFLVLTEKAGKKRGRWWGFGSTGGKKSITNGVWGAARKNKKKEPWEYGCSPGTGKGSGEKKKRGLSWSYTADEMRLNTTVSKF